MKWIYVSIIAIFSTFFLAGCSQVDPVPEQESPEGNLPIQTIHALGDSLTAGYQLPLQDSYPHQLEKKLKDEGYRVKVLNGWISWDTSEGLAKRVDRQLADAKKGDLAILVIWANDGLRGLPLDQLHDNFQEIIGKIKEKELNLIVWGMQIPTNNSPQYRAEFKSIYDDFCQENEWNNAVSCLDFFLDGVAWNPWLNLPDGIHPTKEGYAIIVENLLPLVKNFLTTK